MNAYVYVLKKKNADVFYIGSTIGSRFSSHPERFLDYEVWGKIRVDPRKRTMMESRMIKQALAAGWILINKHMPTEYGENDRIGLGWVAKAIRKGDFEALRAWVLNACV